MFCFEKVSQFVITHCCTEHHQSKPLHTLLHTLLQPGTTVIQHGITVPNHMLTNQLQPTTNGTHHTTTTRMNSPPTTSTDQVATSKSDRFHFYYFEDHSFRIEISHRQLIFLFSFFLLLIADLDSQLA